VCHFFPAFSPKIASGKGQLGSLAEIAISLQIKRLVSGPLQLSNCRSDSNPTEHPPVQTVLGTETVRDRGKAKALFTECVLPLAKSGFRSPTSGVEWVLLGCFQLKKFKNLGRDLLEFFLGRSDSNNDLVPGRPGEKMPQEFVIFRKSCRIFSLRKHKAYVSGGEKARRTFTVGFLLRSPRPLLLLYQNARLDADRTENNFLVPSENPSFVLC
jgi:hypothetical protein